MKQNNKIFSPKQPKDEMLTKKLKSLMEDGVKITPYRIVHTKITLGMTPSGKELSELETYMADNLVVRK